MSNFLELTNGAIRESGQDIDELTSSNFASPPDVMQKRFKTWVQQAWKEIQMTRDDWQYNTARAVVDLYPALFVAEGTGASTPASGWTYTSDDTDIGLTIAQAVVKSGDWTIGTGKSTLYFSWTSGEAEDLLYGEYLSQTAPSNVAEAAKFVGWGRYNFLDDGQVSDLKQVLIPSLMVADPDSDSANLEKLVFVEWQHWQASNEYQVGTRAKPYCFTETPDGDFDFFPRPDKVYSLAFEYQKTLSTLSAYSDSPSELETDFHDVIMWAAVIKYADYNGERTVYQHAKKNYDFYKNRMEKTFMPIPSFARSVYDY